MAGGEAPDGADSGAPIVNIVGERVALGPLRRDLVPTYQRWYNDFATHRTLTRRAPRPVTLEQEHVWYEARLAPEQDVVFIVYELASWRPIGYTAWREIDYRNRTAEFDLAIGEPGVRGQGFGTETTRLMLDYAFTALGLHSAMLIVAAFNPAGIRAYARAGFREFGRRRQCRLTGGVLADMVYMDCLATEFTGSVLAGVFAPDAPRPGGEGGGDA